VCYQNSSSRAAVNPVPYSPYPLSNANQLSIPANALSTVINISFPFVFWNGTYTQLRVSSAGFLTFNLVDNFRGISIGARPVRDVRNVYIQPSIGFWWTDLRSVSLTNVTYQTIGSGNRRQFILNVTSVNSTSAAGVNVQIQLYEGSNRIVIHYINATTAANTLVTVGFIDTLSTGATTVLEQQPAGFSQYSLSFSHVCQTIASCPAGQYVDAFNQCAACPINTYTATQNSNEFCSACPAGTSQPATGQSSCLASSTVPSSTVPSSTVPSSTVASSTVASSGAPTNVSSSSSGATTPRPNGAASVQPIRFIFLLAAIVATLQYLPSFF
jgi:hypothetical protein